MKRVADADLRLLRIFATVVECKGFAVAQAELNLSASSISGYISALEQRLGVRLCTRGRAGFSLTDKGAAIYREAQRLFAALDDFVASAGATRGRLTGTLKIGLVDCTVTDPNAPITRAIRRPTINVPTLVIWGSEDRVLPLAESEALQRGIGGAELAILPDAGHASNQERPVEFNALLRSFLHASHR
jgi:DNA-binding transcriptional LysR family regulator